MIVDGGRQMLNKLGSPVGLKLTRAGCGIIAEGYQIHLIRYAYKRSRDITGYHCTHYIYERVNHQNSNKLKVEFKKLPTSWM
jgi:hypothetical protein